MLIEDMIDVEMLECMPLVVKDACYELDNGIEEGTDLSDSDIKDAVRYFLDDDDREVAPFKKFMNAQVLSLLCSMYQP